jgi:hypothetical protein
LNYEDYIRSPQWKELSAAIKKKRGACERCGGTYRLHCHHKTYARLGQELPIAITSSPIPIALIVSVNARERFITPERVSL